MTSVKEANAQDRMGFVKKVYSILFCQLLISGICIGVTITTESICLWMLDNWWLIIPALIIAIILELMIVCIPPLRRRVPLNYILLLLFTLTEAYMLSFICMTYAYQETCYPDGSCYYDFGNRETISCAGAGTVLISLACTLYACTTKADFTAYMGIIWVAGMSFFIFGLFSIFFWSQITNIIYSTIGVFLGGIYLILDTQLVMGGKRYQLSIDDYIAGALILYADIIMIFLYLLSLFGKR